MSQQTNESEKKRNNKLGLIIAFLAILVIIQGVKWYLDHQKKNELKNRSGQPKCGVRRNLQ